MREAFMLFCLCAAAMSVELPKGRHPVLLVTREEVAALKKKTATKGWAKQMFEKLLAEANDWLNRRIAVPDRGGQWWHWYSCPKCGSRLKTLGPTRHKCPTCGKVYSGEPYDSVVISGQHSRLARAAQTLGLVYQLTGNERYAAKAAEILERYAERYLSYPRHDIRGRDRVGGGRVGPQTLDESTWLIPIAQAYDLVWERLSDKQRRNIEERLLRPAAQLIMQHKIGIHNIQCWKNSAVGLVGICLGDERLFADAVTSAHGIRNQLARGILDDGFWFEGSWGYHYYTMSALVPLAEALRHIGVNVYTERYRRFYAAPLLFALPNGYLPAFNDSHPSNAYRPWPRYELAYARWHDPLFAAVLKDKSRVSLESLLYGEPELEGEATLPSGSRNFPASGYAYLQCDEGQDAPVAILDYAPHGGGHGHPEKLQLVLYANGEVVAPDPGCIHYGVPLHREWYKQTVSHNTLVQDGSSQRPCAGKLRFFHAADAFAVASATANDAYPGTSFARTVALAPGGLVLDLVEVSSAKPHTWDLAFHAYGGFWTDRTLEAVALPGRSNGYQHIRDIRGSSLPSGFTCRWTTERTSLEMVALPSGRGELFAGTGHGQPPSRPLPTILVRRRSESATFASVLRIAAKTSQRPSLVAVATQGRLLKTVVRVGGRTTVLGARFALPTSSVAPHGRIPPRLVVATDATAFLVSESKDSRPDLLAFADGTALRLPNATITASKKATISLRRTPAGDWALDIRAAGQLELGLDGIVAAEQRVFRANGQHVEARTEGSKTAFVATPGRYVLEVSK